MHCWICIFNNVRIIVHNTLCCCHKYRVLNNLIWFHLISSQGSTLAMCPLARMPYLGRRASSGHNNSFYAGPRGQWLSDRWQTHVPVFSVDVSRSALLWFDLQVFSSTVILPVRTSIKTWLTNSIRHVTKLLMPKLNN